jgi:hypothetical protein
MSATKGVKKPAIEPSNEPKPPRTASVSGPRPIPDKPEKPYAAWVFGLSLPVLLSAVSGPFHPLCEKM